MELTVLGCGGGTPRPGGAACGHLLRYDGANVWVDAGNGTLGNLMRYVQTQDVDTVVISHRHWDHFLDLYPFALARWGLDATPATKPFRLVAPPEFLAHAEKLIGEGSFEGIIDWTPLEPGDTVQLGAVTLETAPMNHGVPTLGMRFSAGGRTIAYSADTGPCDELVEIAHDADLLVCEAWFGAGEPTTSEAPVHLSAREAGEHAQRAGARSLVLTHVWYEQDLDAAVAAARSAYDDGPVSAAAEDVTLRV